MMRRIVLFAVIAAGLSAPSTVVLAQSDRWAQPGELLGKKLIDAGIYTLHSSPVPVDSHSLAEHPAFTSTHPFDGIAVRVRLESQWCKDLQTRLAGESPDASIDPHLDTFFWSKQPVSDQAVQEAIKELKRVQWGSLTDNFLWCRFSGGDPTIQIDMTREDDWQAVEHNARIAGRVCREANLKGLLFDTEQYAHYAGSSDPYPLGRGSPAQRRERGRRWIRTLQSECPNIRIIIFFAWSPDLQATDFLKGVRDFLDGMLEGIAEPGRLIHGYENTFYYGQRPGSRFTVEGFPGNRARYESMRAAIRGWRSLARDSEKYDRFVQVGMAAWLESDPWNLWSGWPSGSKHTIWSNVPIALATTDEYVWCWSEHTNFMHQRVGKTAVEVSENWLNPYLASLTNQTFNQGREQVSTLSEDFVDDPLLRGWYFDFDMLSIGRKRNPNSTPTFTRDAVPYVWSRQDQALVVRGTWLTGNAGNVVARHGTQRRRFVHPVSPVSGTSQAQGTMDFKVQTFGSDPNNPIVVGLFRADRSVEEQSLTLRISDAGLPTIVLAGDKERWESKPGQTLQAGREYCLTFDYRGEDRQLVATVRERTGTTTVCRLEGTIPRHVGGFAFDEFGVAQFDGGDTATPPDRCYQYRVRKAEFKSPTP